MILWRFLWLDVLSGLLFVFGGCSSYRPASGEGLTTSVSEAADSNEVVVNDGSVEVRFAPLFDKEKARQYLGINPAKSKIMPALVKVVNMSKEPIKVDLQGSYLAIDPNERWDTLDVGEATRRALRSDAEVVGWMFAFGLPAWYAAASNSANVNRTLEQDYHEKCFKPTLINAGASGQGVIFFDVPQESGDHVSAVVICVRNVNTEICSDIRLVVEQDVLTRP